MAVEDDRVVKHDGLMDESWTVHLSRGVFAPQPEDVDEV